MKLIGYFSLLIFFIVSILSFSYMYINDTDNSYISSARFLDLVEDFPRENFQKMLDSWDYFKENVKVVGWQESSGFIENLNRMINSIGGSFIAIIKSSLSFVIAFVGYGFDLVVWFLSLPYYLIL